MTLEAQLLQIIEQQQKQQESALQRLEAQARTIVQLESYSSKLVQHSQKLSERNTELEKIIQKLRNPQLSENLLTELENDLKQRLENRLMQLVNGLSIESQAKQVLAQSLPRLVQDEIEKQTAPLTEQIKRGWTRYSSITRN